MSFVSDNILAILATCISVLLYMIYRKKSNYFSDKNLPFAKPRWKDVVNLFSIDFFNELPLKYYKEYSASGNSYIGVFSAALKPSIVVLDLPMAEKVLIKDFSHFHDHGFDVDVDNNPLAGHLFNMRGDKWRTLRHKLVPTFTSGKLKGMVPIMEQCGDDLVREMKQDVQLRKEVNLKDLYKRYSLAVIASCAFGIDPNSIKDPNCQFRQILKRVVAPSFFVRIRLLILVWFPRVARIFKIKFMDKEVNDFCFSLTKQSFEMRKKSNVKRNDFIQLLLELKEKGSVEVDTKDLEQDEKEALQSLQSQPPQAKLELTDELLAAQVFVFLVGGFDNAAYLGAITTYTLSKRPDIQARIRDEIEQCKTKHGGINYQSIREMKLLEACIDETLRLYPPASVLLRECTKSYNLDDGKKIDKGMSVLVPVKAFQNDAKYWPKPDEFNPDRFLNNEVVPGSYMPFGDGPRICIAQRLAIITTKVLMAKMLENFVLNPSYKNKEPLKIDVLFGAEVLGGLWGNFDMYNK